MQYHSYLFFDNEPSIHTLDENALRQAKEEFIAQVEGHTGINVQSYGTLGFKVGTRFALHVNGESFDAIQLFIRDLLHTTLGANLRITYAMQGIRRRSQYATKDSPENSDPETPHKYLVIYPFTKTIEWHLMPFEERRTIMKDHVDVGKKYSTTISQMLLYSYGVDDHEFIVSYQMDDLEEFQTLVMDMRATESRRHTKSDVPIFTCIHMPLPEALTML